MIQKSSFFGKSFCWHLAGITFFIVLLWHQVQKNRAQEIVHLLSCATLGSPRMPAAASLFKTLSVRRRYVLMYLQLLLSNWIYSVVCIVFCVALRCTLLLLTQSVSFSWSGISGNSTNISNKGEESWMWNFPLDLEFVDVKAPLLQLRNFKRCKFLSTFKRRIQP